MSFKDILKDESSLKSFFNQLENPLLCLSHDNLMQEANLFAIKILQLNAKQYVGINFRDFCNEQHYSLSKFIDKPHQSGDSFEETYVVNGTHYVILWKIIQLSDVNTTENTERIKKTEAGFLLVGYNLSEERSVIEKLKNTVYFYEDILSKLPTNVYWKDKNCVYMGCNDRLAKVMGLPSREAIKGMTDFDFDWGEGAAESYVAFDQKVMQTGQALTTEDVFKDSTGKVITVLTNKTPLKNRTGDTLGVLAISVDITDKKIAAIELLRAKEKAETASQVKSEFIANMSHDIRTPITGILGLAQSLKDHSENDTNREDAQLLIGATEQLLALLNEIIEVVRIESGEKVNGKEDFDLYAVVNHNLELLQPALREKQLTLRDDVDANVPRYLLGNRVYLSRILLNLLGNAVKFTQAGEVSVKVRLQDQDKLKKQVRLQIVVEDTGIGIPADKFDTIFEHFSRLSPSYEGRYTGYGLGLYTVKRYVNAMNGKIDVDSEMGQGTRFILSLPFALGKAVTTTITRVFEGPKTEMFETTPMTSIASKPWPAEASDTDGSRVLLVEDQPLAARMAVRLLTDLGCHAEHAPDGQQALALVSSQPFDLILMDIGLPDQSGLDVTRHIRQLADQAKAEIPIIALTGHMASDKRQSCLEAGMQDMLTKPLTNLAVENLLATYIVKQTPLKTVSSVSTDELPAIDMEDGMNILGGDLNAAKEVLDILLKILPEDYQAIQEAYTTKDYQRLYDLVHKLYGGLCYCGTPALREITKHIKQALVEQKEKKLPDLMKRLGQEVERLLEAYRQFS